MVAPEKNGDWFLKGLKLTITAVGKARVQLPMGVSGCVPPEI